MNQLPLELVNIISNKLRHKSLYDCKQLSSYIHYLNIKDPYFTIVEADEFGFEMQSLLGTGYLYNGKLYKIEYSDGNKEWYRNGKMHRIGGPAIEYSHTKQWFLNGVCHRNGGGPAVECNDGSKYWYQNGELNRIDGPAIEEADIKMWFLNGKLHRTSGPAIEKTCGTKIWLDNGKMYKQEGPETEWWINERRYRLDDYITYMNESYLKYIAF